MDVAYLSLAAQGTREALQPLWHLPCRGLTAWLPQPCRQGCMNEATMQYERAGWGDGRRDQGSQEWVGSARASRSTSETGAGAAHDRLKLSGTELERHERGIHAMRSGSGVASVTDARLRS